MPENHGWPLVSLTRNKGPLKSILTVAYRFAQPQGLHLHLHSHKLSHRRRQRRALHPEALQSTHPVSVTDSTEASSLQA